jgi:two-component system, LuxR family, sensor kinase FixL
MSGTTNGGRARGYEALRESEELHRATLSSISDAVFVTDDDGVFTYICPNVDVIFGYVPDEVQAIGRLSQFLGENLFDHAELVAKGEICNVEHEVTSKRGERRTLLIQFKRVSIRNGTVLCTCRDITERKQAERELAAIRLQLAHAARLALVGELSASIMHDIRQPLTATLASAGAGKHLAQDPEIREIFEEIEHLGITMAEIIEHQQTLARKRPLDLQPLDVNNVAQDVLHLVAADAHRRRATLVAELTPALPSIQADRVCLQQVLLNLVVNALDAVNENDGAERRVVVRTRSAPDAVEISVSDTGKGIPADVLPKIFDTFFTTKSDGVGLGLAISRSIVEAHAGRIWAEDDRRHGATFRLSLPAMSSIAGR